MIEFAQRERIDDRRASLQHRVLRRAQRRGTKER